MNQQQVGQTINVVREAACVPATLFIEYKKSVIDSPFEREVEPYCFSQGKQDTMIRAYQLTPEEGWRYFMLHRIHRIRVGRKFIPRKKITLSTGEIEETYTPYSQWGEAAILYRGMVMDALADMHISAAEADAIGRFREENRIPPEVTRCIHYSIFHACLGTIISDGVIEEDEIQHAAMINECLSHCGAGILE